MSIRVLLCCSLLCAVASFSHARPVKIWQPAELLKEADVVVIATAKATTDVKKQDLSKAKYFSWVAVETEFEIQAVVKGDWKDKSIFARHHRYFGKAAEARFGEEGFPRSGEETAATVINGPVFVEFDPAKKNSYLIYLKLTKDGWYVPLTGDMDPGDSFFLQQPYRAAHEQPEVLAK